MVKRILVYAVIAILFVVNVLYLEIYADYVSYQQLAKASFILIGAFCTFKIMTSGYNKYRELSITLLAFYLLLLCTAPFSRHFNQIYSCSFVLLSYYVAYYLSRERLLDNKKWIILLAGISVIVLYDFYTQISYILMTRGMDNMGGQNIAYKIVGLMLLASVFMKDLKAVCLIGAYFILVLFCFKKGAVLCGGLMLMVIMFYHIIKYKKYRMAAIVIMFLGFFYIFSNAEFFLRRFFEYSDNYGTNARDIMFSKILDEWFNGNIFNFIFGRGFFHAADINYFGGANNDGFYAHSDYYEMISDYGLFGIIFYLVLVYRACKSTKLTNNTYYKYIQYCLLAVWISKAYYSGIYTTFAGYFVLMTLGYIHGKDVYEENNITNSEISAY